MTNLSGKRLSDKYIFKRKHNVFSFYFDSLDSKHAIIIVCFLILYKTNVIKLERNLYYGLSKSHHVFTSR